MFTGIVQGTAPVSQMRWEGNSLLYAVALPKNECRGLIGGESLSIDGVCQTVVAVEEEGVWFQAISETLSCTTLKDLYTGMSVNFERAAKIGDEIGGHLLSGHVYGVATLVERDDNRFTFKSPSPWIKFLFVKGFIALDGISLTLSSVDRNSHSFTVHLIQETIKRTTLGSKEIGRRVNVEIDSHTQSIVETVENLILDQYNMVSSKN